MRLIRLAALAGLLFAAPAVAAATHDAIVVAPSDRRAVTKRRRQLASPEAPRHRRSRGPQAKPKRKSNRVTISRRTRRRHRRAAR